jgi:hypothetical protein
MISEASVCQATSSACAVDLVEREEVGMESALMR